MGGGGSTTVKSASSLTGEQKQLANTLMNLIAPPTYDAKGKKIVGRQLAQPEYYQGQRLAEMSPQYLQMGQGALQNLSGNLHDVFDPIYGYTSKLWENQIAPQVMERFAGMGNAMSGGAAQALARAGEETTLGMGATLAPLYAQIQQALPGLAQQFGAFEQGARQQPLDVQQQMWSEQQPYNNPYLGLTSMVLPYGQWQENYATQQPAGFGSSLLTGLSGGLGQALGGSNLMGNLTGMLGSLGSMGGSAASGIGSLLGALAGI